ncbi:MAG: hypothetical protein HRF49_07280 [bacterium]
MDRLAALARVKLKLVFRSGGKGLEAGLRIFSLAIVTLSILAVAFAVRDFYGMMPVETRQHFFPAFSWIAGIIWLLSPFTPYAVSYSLHFEGLALLPISRREFGLALVINALLDYLGTLVPVLIIGALIAFGDRPDTALAVLVISAVFWAGLLVTGQMILLVFARAIASRRASDIAMIVGAILVALLTLSRFFFVLGEKSPDFSRWTPFLETAEKIGLFFPPGLAGWAYNEVAAGDYAGAGLPFAVLLAETLSVFILAGWLIQRFFLGELALGGTVKHKSVRARRANNGEAAPNGSMRSFGLSEAAGAFLLKEWRYIFREPIYKMRLINNLSFVIYLVLFFVFFRRTGGEAGLGFADWILPLYAYFSVIGELRMSGNKFGMDGAALESVLVTPVPRSELMIAKAVVSMLFYQSIHVAIILAGGIAFGFPPALSLLCALGMIAGVFATEALGNVISVYFPYRLYHQSGRRGQPQFETRGCTFQLLYMLTTLAGNAILVPLMAVVIAPYYLGAPVAGFALAPVSFALGYLLLRYSLKIAADKLVEREHAILALVTRPEE